MEVSTEQLSFTVVVETENLQLADISRLREALESLAEQDGLEQMADQVLVQDSGNVEASVLSDLEKSFPWITFFKIPHEQGHYEAKMTCVQQIRSDVVVFCDSDCVFQPGWLTNLLQPFQDDPAVKIVGGDTKMEATDAFSLAMVLTHVFDLASVHRSLFSSQGYYANNVAFHRQFLQQNPIPGALPLFRGNCCMHARQMMQNGVTIWRQPQSRAIHATPENWSHFVTRFLKMGSDAVRVGRLTKALNPKPRSRWYGAVPAAICGKLFETMSRTWRLRTNDPQPVVRMLFAQPIIGAALGFYILGALGTFFQPTPSVNDS